MLKRAGIKLLGREHFIDSAPCFAEPEASPNEAVVLGAVAGLEVLIWFIEMECPWAKDALSS